MENTNDHSPSATIIIQPRSTKIDSQLYKIIIRLGWSSVKFGIGAIILYYVLGNRLVSYSTYNVGIISGFCFIIAGLAAVVAGYKKTSYRNFIHAQIWSFLIVLLLAPSLISASIAALTTDNLEIRPICQPTFLSSRVILFENNTEADLRTIPCIKGTYLTNPMKLFYAMQLIIGIICFFAHVILLLIQQKIIKQMKMNDDNNNDIITYTQPSIINTNPTICYSDQPPKYEDLPPRQILVE